MPIHRYNIHLTLKKELKSGSKYSLRQLILNFVLNMKIVKQASKVIISIVFSYNVVTAQQGNYLASQPVSRFGDPALN